MAIFRLRRGVLLQGFHPWSEKKQGLFLKVFCLVFKWKHPESTVWFESSLTFTAFGFSRALWIKRFMPVTPKSATGAIGLEPDQAKLLRDAVDQGKLIFSAPHSRVKSTSSSSEFWRTFSKWRADGKPNVPWSDGSGVERAAAMLDEVREEGKS
jgi:hypothetical protein